MILIRKLILFKKNLPFDEKYGSMKNDLFFYKWVNTNLN